MQSISGDKIHPSRSNLVAKKICNPFEGPGISCETWVGYELGQDSQVVIVCFWTFVFFFSDVLLRCMYGRFFRSFAFSDFDYEDRGFSEFRFFQSWASSCIEIDNSVVVAIQCILLVPKLRRSWFARVPRSKNAAVAHTYATMTNANQYPLPLIQDVLKYIGDQLLTVLAKVSLLHTILLLHSKEIMPKSQLWLWHTITAMPP